MTTRGVVVEYDFAAVEGAEILFNTTRDFLSRLDGIAFDETVEARYLAGCDYQSAFARYFPIVKTKKTAQKASRDLATAFSNAMTERLQSAPPAAFVNFMRILAEKKLKVVLSTRADTTRVADALAPVLGPDVALFHDESTTYGGVKFEAWRRACVTNGLNARSLAVTGSGLGVRSAIVAGIRAVGVTNARVAYQDFSGADAVFKKLDAAAARRILEIMRIA